MKKLSNNNGVIKSSNIAGQRELLREYRNKINEIIDCVSKLEQREAKHELDVITSMQYLEKRVEALEKRLDDKCKGWHVFTMGASKCDRCGIENQPYTAMRSTGIEMDDLVCRPHGKVKYIKSQEDIRENIGKIINEYWGNGYQIGKHGCFSAKTMETDTVVDRILAIVKGE